MDKRNLVLSIVVLGTMMAAVDSTIVILALPVIVQDLHTDFFTAIWIIILYIFVVLVLTTQLGRLGDRVGRDKVYNWGFVVFTIGSALCGASPSIGSLIAFRGLQSLGGAMMQSTGGAVIADTFPPNQRGKAYGYTSIGWNVGAILGIILGGIITTFIGWRYIFYINVPIGIIASILSFRYIKSTQTIKQQFDIVGTILLTISLSLISYGAADIAGEGLVLKNEILIILGLIVFVSFIFSERKAKNPIIDFTIFQNRVLTYSLFASFFQSLGYLSVAFIIIMYLQGVRGLSPFEASLLLVPGYVIASMIAPFTGRLSDKIGARIPATLGMAFMLLAIFVYITIATGVNTPLVNIIIASVIGGIGSSLFYPANNSAIMANARKGIYGGVSGLQRTLANMGLLLSYVIAIAISSLTVPRYVAFEVFLGTYNGKIPAQFISGIHSALLLGSFILAIGLVLSALRGKEVRSEVS
ncbi:MFS transporter [Sulfurisphaera javensis]|uniref:MFS transporter n=1 Tax=Sulfurisphaera javensis TaxID=2049879 RepID=A0AAT9GS54_9CREN